MGRRTRFAAAKEALEGLRVPFVELSVEETRKFRDSWRQVYALPLKKAEGVWHYGGYDWHVVFSYKYTYALEQEDARREYYSQACSQLIVMPNGTEDVACRVVASEPLFLERSQDVYVSPPNLAWTMVFTHEDGWCGPYFSRAQWVHSPPAPPKPISVKGQRRRR